MQASLVAKWMAVGFIHGVMNTDNTTISGETIDYGPSAFMDAYDPATVFSSIDHGGRYAYGNQPAIITWNLARLAEAMLPLFDDDTDTAIESATAVLQTFPNDSNPPGVSRCTPSSASIPTCPTATLQAATESSATCWTLMAEQRVDYTMCLRALSSVVRGDAAPARSLFGEPESFDTWASRWLALVGDDREAIAERMDRANPIYIPRNHIVEEVLTATSSGDHDALDQLLSVVTGPFDERPGLDRYARPAPSANGYRTFCGT